MTFQSTLPRGSDEQQHSAIARGLLFNPRSLAGATYVIKLGRSNAKFSIHAPSRERRVAADHSVMYVYVFNPRSLAGATMLGGQYFNNWSFSIHAPSRERRTAYLYIRNIFGFSIHAPSRERPCKSCSGKCQRLFNPRSLAGATISGMVKSVNGKFSIHAPSRERQKDGKVYRVQQAFSIHAPSRERQR